MRACDLTLMRCICISGMFSRRQVFRCARQLCLDLRIFHRPDFRERTVHCQNAAWPGLRPSGGLCLSCGHKPGCAGVLRELARWRGLREDAVCRTRGALTTRCGKMWLSWKYRIGRFGSVVCTEASISRFSSLGCCGISPGGSAKCLCLPGVVIAASRLIVTQ